MDLINWVLVLYVMIFAVANFSWARRNVRQLTHHSADTDRLLAQRCVEAAGTLFKSGHDAEAKQFEELATTLETWADRFERKSHGWWPVRPQRTQD